MGRDTTATLLAAGLVDFSPECVPAADSLNAILRGSALCWMAEGIFSRFDSDIL